MKVKYGFLMCLASLAFVSCGNNDGDDDSDNPATENTQDVSYCDYYPDSPVCN